MEPRKETACESRRGFLSDDRTDAPRVSARSGGLAGVGEHGNDTRGQTGTWEVLTFPLQIREATPVTKTRPDAATRRRRERTTSQQRYREAKETKQRGRDVRTSELFIVPRKRENPPEGSRGGKGEPVGGTVGGNDAKDAEP
jgi:hypothetical protein